MLKLVRSNRLMRQFSMLDDDYIEHMANIYTSKEAKTIFPNINRIPFEEWLYQQYLQDFVKSS